MRNYRLKVLTLLFSLVVLSTSAQEVEYVLFDTLDISIHVLNSEYKPSRKRNIDIEHTKLEITPSFEKKNVHGKAYIDMRAYNKPVSSVELDAKGMDIALVGLDRPDGLQPLEYTYDSLLLTIRLPREYSKEERFTVFVEYTGLPYKLAERGIELSAGRGMYFIDPHDKNGVKPVQMWTQGETDANSVWFPTFDSPNEQFTQEISITVPEPYHTLSNGLLVRSVNNGDGSRTDHWKQSKPHGPHLAMVAAGQFVVAVEEWNGLELSYYTVAEYSADVKKVFGRTASMIAFYEDRFGIEFPWEKYAQMVVYDYTSGAMENTTAVILYDAYYADEFDLLDRNYDETIAHEIAHQWFGDLVACESWAHLALNESFATYAEYLWYEHRYSTEDADRLQHEYLFDYFNEFLYKSEPIVNYYYDDADDLFDSHRYEKGSCVLHMLRNYLGDDDFFEGLELYLREHQFGSAEMDHVRLALEEVSGEDLHWFFEQWFMNEGHPVVEIRQSYDPATQMIRVDISQIQDIDQYLTFQFPLAIDIYVNGGVERMQVWVDERKETFGFHSETEPDLVNVDAKKIMLWEKYTDLTNEEFAFQYHHAPLYIDRLEAIDGLRWVQNDEEARKVMMEALNDPSWGIRKFTLQNMELKKYTAEEYPIQFINELALSDPVAQVRRSALEALANLDDKYALPVAELLLDSDSSRMVKAVALKVLHHNNPEAAYEEAVAYSSYHNNYLENEIAPIFAEMGRKEDHEFFKRDLWSVRPYYVDSHMGWYVDYLKRMDPGTVEVATDLLLNMALYEESDQIKSAARNALYDLHEHYSKPGSSSNFGNEQLLKKAIDELPGSY